MSVLTHRFAFSEAGETLFAQFSNLPRYIANHSPRLYQVLGACLALPAYGLLLAIPVATAMVTFGLISTTLSGEASTLSFDFAAQLAGTALGVWVTSYLYRVRPPESQGIRVDKNTAVALRGLVSELREQYRAPAIHRIVLTGQFAVETIRTPVLGVPLIFRTRLAIGLPVLLAMSTKHFRGLLAGRIGQLAGGYDRWSGWFAQMNETWLLHQRNANAHRSLPAFLLRGFFAWYAPLFTWYVRPALRRQALEFDRYAQSVLDNDDLADMWASCIVVERFLEERYWPTIFKAADQVPEPTFMPNANFQYVLAEKLRNDDTQRWLREALTSLDDSVPQRPSLRARLDEIGYQRIGWPAITGEKASEALLDADCQALIGQLDQQWIAHTRAEWNRRFDSSQNDRNRLRVLRKQLEQGRLRGKDAMTYAGLTKKFGDPNEAIEAHKKILELNPGDPQIHFGVGKFLVHRGDANGVKALERAMDLDKQYVDPACRLISEFTANSRKQASLHKYVNSMPQRPSLAAVG